jgi:hypothetical protein
MPARRHRRCRRRLLNAPVPSLLRALRCSPASCCTLPGAATHYRRLEATGEPRESAPNDNGHLEGRRLPCTEVRHEVGTGLDGLGAHGLLASTGTNAAAADPAGPASGSAGNAASAVSALPPPHRSGEPCSCLSITTTASPTTSTTSWANSARSCGCTATMRSASPRPWPCDRPGSSSRPGPAIPISPGSASS